MFVIWSCFSDVAQKVGSEEVDVDSQHNADDAGNVDDVRQILTELIGDVVQRSIVVVAAADCSVTSLKRHATLSPTDSSPPPHKRPVIAAARRTTLFDPVAEHQPWCPYVKDAVCDAASNVAHRPWLRLLRQLVPRPQDALTRLQSSPLPDGIDRIRKLFRSWTSSP